MAKKAKDNSKLKFLYSVISILIVVFVIYHTFGSLINPYVTQEVVSASIKKTISSDFYVVRKENVITSDYSGYKVFTVPNGDKIAKDSQAVLFYENASDVALANEIIELDNYIKEIEEIDKQNSIQVADIDIISNQAQSSVFDFLKSVNDNNFSKATEDLSSLRYYLAQSQLVTGREQDYSAVISEYRKKLAAKKKEMTHGVKVVKSDYSGYFVNFTDGYENSFDYENIDKITTDQIQRIKANKPSKAEVGKVISENEWYLVTVVDTTDVKDKEKGDTVVINTMLSSVKQLKTTVVAANRSKDGKKTALVLKCMEMNEELSTMRKKNMQIVLNTYTGLKVDAKAIRVKNKQKGVYVKFNNIIRFVPVNVIYSTSEYCIVDTDYSNGQLKIYDDVVVKGKDLDG